MKKPILILTILLVALNSKGQTKSTHLIQEPAWIDYPDTIYKKAALKKTKSVMRYRMEGEKPILSAYANINNLGNVTFSNSKGTYFERVYYTYTIYGSSVRRLKTDITHYPLNGDILITDETYDFKGLMTSCYTKVTQPTIDTFGVSKVGWRAKIENGLITQKNHSDGETDYYTYDSHKNITEIKRYDEYESELYERKYTGNNLIETTCTFQLSKFLLEKFEYNAAGLVSKSAFYSLFGPLSEESYEYDAAGRLTKKTDTYRSYKFTYDSEGQLIQHEQINNGSKTTENIIKYNYNEKGLLASIESKAAADNSFTLQTTFVYTYWE